MSDKELLDNIKAFYTAEAHARLVISEQVHNEEVYDKISLAVKGMEQAFNNIIADHMF